jgi:hypothetical protein
MSDGVAIVTRWLDAFNHRDLEGLLAVADPDLTLRPMRWVQRREYRGHAGIREWLEEIRVSPFATTIRTDSACECSAQRVVVEGTIEDGSGTPREFNRSLQHRCVRRRRVGPMGRFGCCS